MKSLYLFYGIMADYTSGIAGSIADNKKQAIANIVQQFKRDLKQTPNNKIIPLNHTGTTNTTVSSLTKELEKCKTVKKISVDEQFSFYIGGGS